MVGGAIFVQSRVLAAYKRALERGGKYDFANSI